MKSFYLIALVALLGCTEAPKKPAASSRTNVIYKMKEVSNGTVIVYANGVPIATNRLW